MTNKINWFAIITALLISSHVSAADILAGEKFSENCVSCHGNTGISPSPEVPNLAGQRPEYIITRVEHFSDKKQGDSLMHGVSLLLNNKTDIENVAAYYAQLPRARYPITDQARVDEGQDLYIGTHKCHFCHGQTGQGLINEDGIVSPVVIGQSKAYIVKALHDFRANRRSTRDAYMMNFVLGMTTDEDIELLAEFLSTQ